MEGIPDDFMDQDARVVRDRDGGAVLGAEKSGGEVEVSEFKIDRGVPMPEEYHGPKRYHFPWAQMEIGDSFEWVLPTPACRNTVIVSASKAGIKVQTRKIGPNTLRVWRIA
jgi:hypothetical protein